MNDVDSFLQWEQACMAPAELKLASLSARAMQGSYSFSWHEHPFIEWGLVLEGECSWLIGSQSYELAEGEMILVPQGAVHRESIAPHKSARLSWVGFTFCGNLATAPVGVHSAFVGHSTGAAHSVRAAYSALNTDIVTAAHSIAAPPGVTVAHPVTGGDAHACSPTQREGLMPCKLGLGRWSDEIRRLFLAIYDEQSLSEFGSEARIRLCLSELLLLVTRAMIAQRQGTAQQPAVSVADADISQRHVQLAHAASRFFDNNTEQGVRIDAVARYFRLTPQYFSTLFRRVHGVSPAQYLQAARVRHACRLLAGSQLSIKEIASRCGYADSAHFCRQFKTHTGYPPAQYRLR